MTGPAWQRLSAELHAHGYNHTAGDNFAKLHGRGLRHARIVRDEQGEPVGIHCLEESNS